MDFVVHGDDLVDQILVFCLTPFGLKLGWQGPSANVDAVVTIERTQFTRNLVLDQLVKALEELGAQVVMQEVDESKAESLLTVSSVPMTHLIQIDTLIHLTESCCE